MKILVAQARAAACGGAENYAAALVAGLTAAGHAVGHIDIDGHTPPGGAPTVRHRAVRHGSLLMWAQVCRRLPAIARDYDRVILAYGEGPQTGVPTLTIRHAPQLFGLSDAALGHLGARGTAARRGYVRLCRAIAGPVVPGPALANSHWTAGQAQALTGIGVGGVLYPPVARPVPLPDVVRDPFGIVALGRIVPNKRLEDGIAVTAALREQGVPATFTIIGRAQGRWAHRQVAHWSGLPHVRLLTNADDSTKLAALATATYGFHGYRGEHFGIAVAEMIGHGVLPLVYDDGGVRELVPDPNLRFRSREQAVEILVRHFGTPSATAASLTLLQNGVALRAAWGFERAMHAALGDFLDRGGLQNAA